MTGESTATELSPVDRTDEALAELYALLATAFAKPDEAFVEAVNAGRLQRALERHVDRATLEVSIESPPAFDDATAAREGYRRTFSSYGGSFAPPVESVYEPWHDGRDRGLLAGPAAVDMRRRYEAIDAELPPGYQPDHIAPLLEYGSLLLEAGEHDAYERFHREHLEWLPAFRARIEETCDEPFYRWAVRTLETVLDAAGSAVGVEDQ